MQRMRMLHLLAGASVLRGYSRPSGGNSPRACIDCGESCGPGRPGRRCRTCRDLYAIDELRIRANRMGITCRQANELLRQMTSGNVILRHEPGQPAEQRERFREHCIQMATDGREGEIEIYPIPLGDPDLLVRELVQVGGQPCGEFQLYTSGLLTFRCIPEGTDDGDTDTR